MSVGLCLRVHQRWLKARSGRAVRVVSSAQRPVPLRFAYSEKSVAEALQELTKPVYVAPRLLRLTSRATRNNMN